MLAGVPTPIGLVFDDAGNAYITANGGLRRVDAATGIITTIESARDVALMARAGTAAHSMCRDAEGLLYFAGRQDPFNSGMKVWSFDPATGESTTVASLPTDPYAYAATVIQDPQGNLTVSLRDQNAIYRVTLPTGVVTRIAGTGVEGLSGDDGPATAAQLYRPSGLAYDASGNLFVADVGNNRIRRIDAATGTITSFLVGGVAGGAGNLLFAPNGDLYLHRGADIQRRDASTGLVEPYANLLTGVGQGGTGVQAPGWPLGMAFEPSGDLCVSNVQRVVRIDKTTRAVTPFAGVANFTGNGGPALEAPVHAADIAVDAGGNVYLCDLFSDQIRRIDATTGIITTIAGPSNGWDPAALFRDPRGLAMDTSGGLLVADFTRVIRIDLTTGVVTTIAGDGTEANTGDGGPATAAAITPSDVAVDPSGNIFVSCSSSYLSGRRVRRIDSATGIITTFAGTGSATFSGDGGPAVDAGIPSPLGIDCDSLGNLYIADQGFARRVRRVDATTGVITTVAGNGYWGSVEGRPATETGMDPTDVAVDASGNVFVADRQSNRVRRIDAATGLVHTVAGAGTDTLGYPAGDGGPAYGATLASVFTGLAFDAAGDLLVAGPTLRRIRNPNGTWVLIQAPSSLVLQPTAGPAGADASFAVNLVGLPATGSTLVVKNLTTSETLLTVTASSGWFYPSGRFPMGASTVEARVLDAGGATLAVSTFAAQVADTQAPWISGGGPKTLTAPSTPVPVSLAVLGVTVGDAVDPSPGTVLSVTELAEGTTSVTVTATDATGNTSTVTFDVTVAVTPLATIETYTPSGYPRSIEVSLGTLQTGGVTTATTQDYGPDLPGNYQFGGDYVWYELVTTATFTGQVTLSFSWTEGEFGDEGSIRLLHFENEMWVDITTSVDTEANRVYGATGSLSPFAVAQVLDALPPVIEPTADVAAKATSTLGAVVTFTAPAAVDAGDGPVPVTCVPSSGTLFEVGVTTVRCTASDSHGNASTTTFDVIVQIDAHYLKGAVADQLNSLIATSDKPTVKKLLRAIKDIQDGLADDLWTDALHLSEKGRKAFKEDSEAVAQLLDISSPVSGIGQAISSLVEADRVLAATALADATAANPTSSHVTTASAMMEAAAAAVDAGSPREAIKYYRQAWKASLKALGLL